MLPGMMRLVRTAVAVLACSAGLWAHHAYATFYNIDQRVTLKGRVASVQFTAPHVMLTIETKSSGRWQAEWTNIAALAQGGVVADTVKVGDVLEIDGSPSKNAASKVVSALCEVRRRADGWRWSRTEACPQTIE